MGSKAEKQAARFFTAGAIIGGVWLGVKYLLPWIAPLLLAFAFAALIETPVKFLVRHRWKRAAAAAIVTAAVLALIVFVTAKLTTMGIESVTRFARDVPRLMDNVSCLISGIKTRIEQYAAAAPESVRNYISAAADSFGSFFYTLPEIISKRALDALAKAASGSPTIFLFAVTAGIGSFFFSATFPSALAFIIAQLPEGLVHRLNSVGADLKKSFGALLRSELILMSMTFFELTVVLLLLKIDNAILIAAVTAFIDALPIFGTGIVLLPWSAYLALSGDVKTALALTCLWAGVNLVRSCVQAKLLGDQIGLDPIASLLAMYAGFKVWGVGGMLLFPIILVTAKQLNDSGTVKLWKRA